MNGSPSACAARTSSLLSVRSAPYVRSTSAVRNAIYHQLEVRDEDVVIDMSDVSTIDVTALRLLAVATRHAWLTGHHLTVRNPGPAVRRMAHLARLAHALEVERVAASA